MKMELLEINALWLKQAGVRMKTTPEALLNGIIHHLRTYDGDGPRESLEDWLNSAGATHLMAEELLTEIRDTRLIVDEAARATRLYISRIEAERNPLGPATPPTPETSTRTPEHPDSSPSLTSR